MNEVVEKSIDNKIDLMQAELLKHEPIICPLEHDFADGMYIRTIFMPKGREGIANIITSAIHNTRHPFFILKGIVAVFSENDGEQILEAGDYGITLPNTRRVLRIIEDTVWVTCHATNIKPKDNSKEAIEEAVQLIIDSITDKRINPLLDTRYFNNIPIPYTAEEEIIREELNNKKISHE